MVYEKCRIYRYTETEYLSHKVTAVRVKDLSEGVTITLHYSS
jgi:hypothetical protein